MENPLISRCFFHKKKHGRNPSPGPVKGPLPTIGDFLMGSSLKNHPMYGGLDGKTLGFYMGASARNGGVLHGCWDMLGTSNL